MGNHINISPGRYMLIVLLITIGLMIGACGSGWM